MQLNIYLPVYPNQPVFCRVSLFQIRQLEIFVADYGVSRTIVTSRCPVVQFQFSKPIITQFVHQTIQQSWRAFGIDAEFAVFREIIGFLKKAINEKLNDIKIFFNGKYQKEVD